MDYEKLGDNIRNYREQRGFTQEKLAELSNISEKHLSKIERGKINIKIDTLVNIADALGTSVDKLLLDASSYVEPDYISQITYHLSKLSRKDQERLLWHLEQNNVFEIKKKALLKLYSVLTYTQVLIMKKRYKKVNNKQKPILRP